MNNKVVFYISKKSNSILISEEDVLEMNRLSELRNKAYKIYMKREDNKQKIFKDEYKPCRECRELKWFEKISKIYNDKIKQVYDWNIKQFDDVKFLAEIILDFHRSLYAAGGCANNARLDISKSQLKSLQEIAIFAGHNESARVFEELYNSIDFDNYDLVCSDANYKLLTEV